MSSSKRVRAVSFVAAIFFALGSAVAQNNFLIATPEPQLSAWWLRTAFYPFEKEVRRIPVRKIRSTWCKATEFRKELFQKTFNRTSPIAVSRSLWMASSTVRKRIRPRSSACTRPAIMNGGPSY